MRILIFILCLAAFSNNIFANESTLPTSAEHIDNISKQRKWFELQEIRKELLKKNPYDIAGLILKALEEHAEFRTEEFKKTLNVLEQRVRNINVAEPTKSQIILSSFGILSQIPVRNGAGDKLSAADYRKVRKNLHSGQYPLMSESFTYVFSLLEKQGLFTLKGLDIKIKGFPFVHFVASTWNQKTNGWQQVLNISEKLLGHNSYHIAGLILKAEYEFKALQYDKVQMTISRIIEAGEQIKTTKFMENFPSLKESLQRELGYVAEASEAEVKARQGYMAAGGGGGLMALAPFLLDCEEDGLVSMADLEDKKSFNYYWAIILGFIFLIGIGMFLRQRK